MKVNQRERERDDLPERMAEEGDVNRNKGQEEDFKRVASLDPGMEHVAISYWENNNELAKCAAEIFLSTNPFCGSGPALT